MIGTLYSFPEISPPASVLGTPAPSPTAHGSELPKGPYTSSRTPPMSRNFVQAMPHMMGILGQAM